MPTPPTRCRPLKFAPYPSIPKKGPKWVVSAVGATFIAQETLTTLVAAAGESERTGAQRLSVLKRATRREWVPEKNGPPKNAPPPASVILAVPGGGQVLLLT